MLQCEHGESFFKGWALPYVVVWRDRADGKAKIVDWCKDKSQAQRLKAQREKECRLKGLVPETYHVEDIVARIQAWADITNRESVLNEIELLRTVEEAKRRG